MKRLLHHVVIPSAILIAFFAVALTPVELLGYRGRGLTAVLIALLGVLFALGAAIMGARGKMRADIPHTFCGDLVILRSIC